MNPAPHNMANERTTLSGLLGALLLVALPGVQCNKASCEDKRDELYAQKLEWQTCERDVDCVIVGGSSRDCTGIMSCNFAVNRSSREAAERRVASLPEETQDCFECASPNCEEGSLPHCEPVSGRCMVISELIEVDGGTGISGGFSRGGAGGRPSGNPGGNAGAGGSDGVAGDNTSGTGVF